MISGAKLELEFLATGTWQHVFVGANGQLPGWIYKIPAAFGDILPFRHPQRFRSNKLLTDTSHQLLLHLPRAEKMLAARLRHRSAQKFSAMLELVEFMLDNGLGDILLPCEIIRRGAAELRVNHAVAPYCGAILKQRRSEDLFERSERLREIDWHKMVETHHRLWRHGITFTTSTAVLGLKNWALFEGRLRLFDTSSLTRDPAHMRRALSLRELDKKENSLRAKHAKGGNSSQPLLEFVSFIRRELNSSKLEQLWCVDVRADKPVENRSPAAALNVAP